MEHIYELKEAQGCQLSDLKINGEDINKKNP